MRRRVQHSPLPQKEVVNTNKYLLKVAALSEDTRDVNKTFLKSSLGAWTGHLGGMAVGGAAVAGLAAKNQKVGRLARKLYTGTRWGLRPIARSKPLKAAGKFFTSNSAGKIHPKIQKGVNAGAVVGGIVGGAALEEGLNYAATRHSVLQAKENARNEKRAEALMYKIAEILLRE